MVDLAVETVRFPNGNQSSMVRVHQTVAGSEIVSALGVASPRAVVVLNGGTTDLEEVLEQQLQYQIVNAVARFAAEEQITLITGGTAAGVFALLSQGLSRWGRTAPCIGVAVDALTQRLGHPQGDVLLDPDHSHFVLVDGQQWGDETKVMYALVDELAQHCHSVAVFAGGGQIVIREMLANVVQGRDMILLAGSGRTTDAVLAARINRSSDNDHLMIAQRGKIIQFDIRHDPAALRDLLRATLLLNDATSSGDER